MTRRLNIYNHARCPCPGACRPGIEQSLTIIDVLSYLCHAHAHHLLNDAAVFLFENHGWSRAKGMAMTKSRPRPIHSVIDAVAEHPNNVFPGSREDSIFISSTGNPLGSRI